MANAIVLGTAFGADSSAACPKVYLPVCGLQKPAGPTTFGNSCEAGRAKAPILHDGRCVGAGQSRCAHNNAFPVCAINLDKGYKKTYDNLCWAEKDWSALLYKGPCR